MSLYNAPGFDPYGAAPQPADKMNLKRLYGVPEDPEQLPSAPIGLPYAPQNPGFTPTPAGPPAPMSGESSPLGLPGAPPAGPMASLYGDEAGDERRKKQFGPYQF